MTSNKNRLILADNVRIFYNDKDEIRIRKGVWNYEEASLSLEDVGNSLKESFTKLFHLFDEGISVDIDSFLNEEKLVNDERNQMIQVIETLKAQNYFHSENDNLAQQLFYNILGGTTIGKYYDKYSDSNPKPLLFFADTQTVREYGRALAEEINLPISILSENEYKDIATMDCTTRFDGYETRKQMEELGKFIQPYSGIIGCMERPHINFLRNINRILVKTSKVLSMALLDGPFMNLFTIKPPETGCFECFENRLLARMQDMSVYRNFVERTKKSANIFKEKTHVSPLMKSLASAVIFEGLLVSNIGKAKLAGRVLSIYLPILEIQAQDLLRVPFCPACGSISETKMEEMYTSTKKIVDKIIENIAIK